MPIRRVIEIDEELCNGCGLCAQACHEGAIGMVDGKAKLLRDDYCDGLGDCLPTCPTGAISFVEREAAPYNEAAVAANLASKNNVSKGCVSEQAKVLHAVQDIDMQDSCPSVLSQILNAEKRSFAQAENDHCCSDDVPIESQLNTWPIQIKLAPLTASFFNNTDLLIAADCTPFAYASFHTKFLKGHVCLIGCPKLDGVDYSDKLSSIIANNDIRSVTVVRMVVPCCGGLEQAAKRAIEMSGKIVPFAVATISLEGEIL